MRCLLGKRRYQRRCGSAGANHQNVLAGVVDVGWPCLRVDNLAFEVVHPRPIRRIALLVPIVSLAHPKEVGRKRKIFTRLLVANDEIPTLGRAIPIRRNDAVTIPDMALEIVLLNHGSQIGEDFLASGDWCLPPQGLKLYPEVYEIAVRTHTGIAMRMPSSPKRLLQSSRRT